jgi:hypothetical protein
MPQEPPVDFSVGLVEFLFDSKGITMYSMQIYGSIVMVLAASISKGVPVNPTEQSEKTQQAPKESAPAEAYQTATFAAGCFWGVEHVFSLVPGVKNVQVGFMGGHVEKPSL